MLTSKEFNDLAHAVVQTDAAAAKPRSLWSDARRRFLRNRAAVISLCLLSLIASACIIGPWILPHAFDSADWDAMNSGPSFKNAHFWGTDDAGRDLLVRCLIGGRVSLTVGLLATLASVSLGIVWGATAGFLGGRIDAVMMRVVDMMYAIPYLLIAILLVTILGREFYLVVITITVFSWMDMARVVRGQTLSLRSMEYVEAMKKEREDYKAFMQGKGVKILPFPAEEREKWAELPEVKALIKNWIEEQNRAGRPGTEVMKTFLNIFEVPQWMPAGY